MDERSMDERLGDFRRGRGRGGPWREHGHGGGRRRRGDIRTAVLSALEESPAHGYEIIQRFEEKTAGAWRPSAGSIYPTLQLLEDEGLVRSYERDGKKVYELTDEGRATAAQRVEEGGSPWASGQISRKYKDFGDAMRQLALASRQAAMTGNPEVMGKVVEILTDARKRIYTLLAES
jgi:DNA-binding PadR family transcriptional regulator